jgi:hypothetical protein
MDLEFKYGPTGPNMKENGRIIYLKVKEHLPKITEIH